MVKSLLIVSVDLDVGNLHQKLVKGIWIVVVWIASTEISPSAQIIQ